jgi:hypothetical protein
MEVVPVRNRNTVQAFCGFGPSIYQNLWRHGRSSRMLVAKSRTILQNTYLSRIKFVNMLKENSFLLQLRILVNTAIFGTASPRETPFAPSCHICQVRITSTMRKICDMHRIKRFSLYPRSNRQSFDRTCRHQVNARGAERVSKIVILIFHFRYF